MPDETKKKKKKKKRSIWDILSTASVASIALMVVLVAVMLIGLGGSGRQGVTGMITADDAGRKVSNFIVDSGMVPEGTPVSVEGVQEESGLYQVNVSISVQGQEQKVVVYITKDGKYFFPQGMNMEEAMSQAQ